MMKRSKALLSFTAAGLLAMQLTACGSTATQSPAALAAQPQPSAVTVQSNSTATAILPGAAVRAIGEVKASQDANLTFQVSGTVAQVLVKEGDMVKKDQLLAVLDTRAFDEKVSAAQAALQLAQAQLQATQAQLLVAQAQLAALTDPPKPALVKAAQAQVEAAKIALAQARNGQNQNVISAQSGLTAAQESLKATKDKLAYTKTAAESAVEQAANNLRTAQDAYSKIYWDNRELEKLPGDLPQAKKDAEAAAQRTVENAEESLHQAQLALENARQAETTNIQAAEQQVVQAQASLDKVNVPAGQDSVASADASLKLAQANLANLQPDPRPSEKARLAASVEAAKASISQAEATVAQAQAALTQAQLNRSYAEIHAPYDGVIAQVNVDSFDASAIASQAAIRMIDVSNLRVEVQIADTDIARVREGQKVRVDIDAVEKSFDGTVSYIAPEATSNGTIRSYLVRIELDKQDDLRAGMPVTVNIVAD